MGGWDVYCALCGGPFSVPELSEPADPCEGGESAASLDELESDDPYSYDNRIVHSESEGLNWLEDVRLIGENPEVQDAARVWVSGPASYDTASSFEVEAGDDPNLFQDQTDYLETYMLSREQPPMFPFHVSCHMLLAKRLNMENVDKAIFYQTLKSLLKHSSEYTLCFDYGSVSNSHEQYWSNIRGFEHFVFSPADIPGLRNYYRSLPTLAVTGLNALRRIAVRDGDDPFSRLPTETILQLISLMDAKTVCRLKIASRAVYNVELRNDFWRERLEREMPWLYDFPYPGDCDGQLADWAKVFRELYLASEVVSKTKIQGLANRRRIWEEVFPTIVDAYLAQKAKLAASSKPVPLTLENASPIYSGRLILPVSRQYETSTVPLITDYSDLLTATPVLAVSWRPGIEFVNIEVVKDGYKGNPEHRIEYVPIPRDDWLTGIIVTTKDIGQVDRAIAGVRFLFARQKPVQIDSAVGSQRLLHVSDRHFIAGLRVYFSYDRLVTDIALLEQPIDLVPGIERIIDYNRSSYNLDAMRYLWYQDLPPQDLDISYAVSGYAGDAGFGHNQDVCPLETLLFGATEEELADVTAFSADVLLGGFEVDFGTLPTRSIGPRKQAMRTLAIDGHGGERIITIQVQIRGNPFGFRLITNRGRQLVIGKPTDDRFKELLPTSDDATIPVLTGIYAWWISPWSQRTTLEAMGCLTLRTHLKTAELPGAPRDAYGFCWDPSPPPPELVEDGIILGENDGHIKSPEVILRVPSPGTVVSWLDCSRPLKEVRVLLCHRSVEDQLALSSITFAYSDGDEEEVSVGPGRNPILDASTADRSTEWCWCKQSNDTRHLEKELKTRYHYMQEKWLVGGKKLHKLSVWLSGETWALSAIQMTAEGGAKSMYLGVAEYSESEPSEEISFVGDDAASGLKFYLDDNQRQTDRNDTIVMAIQALKKAS